MRHPSLLGLAVLSAAMAAAQTSRDEWKLMQHSFDFASHLTQSLADAHLSSGGRQQIYRTVDGKTIHDSFTDRQRDEERNTIRSARVGFINLAVDGSQQILVQAPASFCGASGNCALWIFLRNGGHLQLALETGGSLLIVRDTSNHRLHDLATGWHMSAREEAFATYRFDGAKYVRTDCFSAKFDSDNTDHPPTITDCLH